MPVDYHAWTHRPKELGGTDPLDIPLPSEAVYANAQRLTAFNHTGSTSFGWVDVHTNDTSAFDVDTTNVANDTVVLNQFAGNTSAIAIVISAAGKTTPSNDWGISAQMSQMNPTNGGGFAWTAGQGTSGGALGAMGLEIRMGVVFLPSFVIPILTHTGTMNFAFASQHIIMLPISTGSDWIDIL